MNPTSGKKPKSPLKVKAPEFPSHGRKDADTGEYVIILTMQYGAMIYGEGFR